MGRIEKSHENRLKFCLTFPDIYDIGMSHLGFRIIYSKLNESDNIVCERFFAPNPDALETLGGAVMVSLESRTPIKEFDVLGFSFQYEMSYTTALQLLVKGGIPLLSADRNDNDPIIIAGGGCILNPAPLSAFIDVFFMGEMDIALTQAMERLYQLRKSGATRREQLEMLNEYPFTYIPLIEPKKVAVREIFKGFSTDSGDVAPLVPIMPVVQDRIAMEIARGCTNGCRFCQAGMIYRPVREKGVANLCGTALNMLNSTGYQEISLLSLDTGDYSQIEPLLEKLGSGLNERKISLSLPSLRAETVNPAIFEKIGAVRKSGFTIAPEAGSQRLRDIINKNLSEEEIINAAVYAKNAGYSGAKLYFMCGLPYETDEDILEIAVLVRKIKYAVKGGGRGFNLTISMSNFVPKPHTPFERFGQLPPEELKRRHFLLKDELRRDKVMLKYHDVTTSSIEAAIARGDSRWTKLLTNAIDKGFYLDAWSEYFSRDRWRELFTEEGLTIADFASHSYTDDEDLPWSTVNCGLDNKWLLRERDNAANACTTEDCRHGKCSACGVCDFKTIKNTQAEADPNFNVDRYIAPTEFKRYELLFEKHGVGVFMSALDLVRIFTHILIAAGVTLKFTEGFNPIPRTVLQAPTPVGVAGDNESLLLELAPSSIKADTLQRINALAPAGVKVLSIQEAVWAKNLSSYTMTYRFDEESFNFIKGAIDGGKAFYEKTDKQGRPKVVKLEDFLIAVGDNTLDMSITDKGAFHLPEFFRRSCYEKIPTIVRTNLKPYA
jgi:radical SAM family uncharacterized protein/radical SAM-linked protein